MLTIRREQMEALSAARMRQFEDRMINHLSGVYTDTVAKMGESRLRELIHGGVIKAYGYDIQSEKCAALFIQLMVAITHDFDEQPEFSWMLPILQHSTRAEQVKMDMIYNRLQQQAPQIKLPGTSTVTATVSSTVTS